MKNLAIYLAAGASALLVTAASAAPLSPNAAVAPESNIQNVRMVCNEVGQCWRQRGERRVIIREQGDFIRICSPPRTLHRASRLRGTRRHRHPRARRQRRNRYRSLLSEPTTVRSEYKQSRGEIRGFAISKPNRPEGIVSRKRARTPRMRRSPWPGFTREGRLLRAGAPRTRKPRSQRTRERKTLRRQGTSALNCYPWHPPSACRFLFAANGAPARSATPPRSSDQTFIFENLPRPDRKSPALRGRKPLQPRCISNRGCNRTHSATPARRRRHPAEFVSMRPRR